MREHRNLRLVSALTIAATLSVSVLASTAFAALPNVIVGGGGTVPTNACDPSFTPVSGATPSTVSPDGVVGFRIWAKNCDTSTIQAFTLGTASGAPPLYDPPGDATGVVVSTGTCAAGPVLDCSFGTFRPGDEIVALVAFVAPHSGSVNIDFQWKTTGQGPDKKGRSHGDTIHWNDSAAIGTGGGDYAGQFALDATLLAVSDVGNLNNGNKQSTAVDAAALASELGGGVNQGFPITVQDGAGIDPGCVDDPNANPAIVCTDLVFFGETSIVNVKDGFTFTNAFKITITIYKGPNANQVHGVYHNWTDGSGFHQELITTTFPAGGTPPSVPSFSVQKIGQNTVLTIYSYHNGPYRGF